MRSSAMPIESVVHVIDDDAAMRKSLAFLLKSARIKAQVYSDVAAFLDVLPQLERGCIVTDVRMPGSSGIELLKRLHYMKLTLLVMTIIEYRDVPLAVEDMK